ncbi:hypothetical protein Q8A67_023875 [Cirrhinus molitorella]|uniref:Uncharacterized protein n=1 Tax=Cirrhinus molitorella TaxID=172907 RepID=A0AA88P6U3_9TELE|nr:hypothetical protein Q8A67_023875 [Cirrhinus molitorella]
MLSGVCDAVAIGLWGSETTVLWEEGRCEEQMSCEESRAERSLLCRQNESDYVLALGLMKLYGWILA